MARGKRCAFVSFFKTTGLKETWVRDQLQKQLGGVYNKGTEKEKVKNLSIKKSKLVDFLNSLPKVESHYCRKKSSKLYLEPLFSSMSAVFQLYKSSCGEDSLSRYVFEEQFHAMNISIFKPCKDQCDLCVSYQEGNIDEIQ